MKLIRHQYGFTLAELLVASVISGALLAGVAAVMRQFLTMEKTLTVSQGDRQRARQLAQYLENRLESLMNLKDRPAVKLAPSKDGQFNILDLVYSDFNDRESTAGLLRIKWSKESPVACFEQSIPVSGSMVLLPGNVEDTPEALEAFWENVPSHQIAEKIDTFSLKVREGPTGGWKDQWTGSSGRGMFQVEVVVGEAREERQIVPQVNGKVLE
jgi:prepilin-type N-terminal cleavage/methylation domain-containing protein